MADAATIEAMAETAYLAHQQVTAPRNRYPWSSITENSKKPWRAVAAALAPDADEIVRRTARAVVSDMLEKRASYFDRTTGHFDRSDAARSYRSTAREVASALEATQPN